MSIGVEPNGFNINDKCGSTYPYKIQSAVRKYKAHAGISFDGDADRIIMCDESGKIIDGDQIIAMLARRWKSKRILRGGVIGTLMSNYGLESFLRSEKIKFFRSGVGDRYVKEKMKKLNFNLGGEQSGHIILGKFATTGDGLMVALEVLFSLRKGKRASELLNVFEPLPQILENVVVKDKNVITKTKCKKAIKKANKLMGGYGRLLVRKSGTEPKIRIMAESYDKNLILKCIKIIKSSIK
jgi:phosphoglucosamine mutase